ncbi:MAG: hypothetical protein CL764_00165 [Chloroflexi bacterium]|nr:hypothetical protein [Chloroflexota bacterium]|tara:strand:+ start:806 stop:1345 length:540 start_codon:yes stop_codon:yes gene_type:complete
MNKILISATFFLIILGCSNESPKDNQLEIISNTEKIITFEDIKSIGFKKNRTYDVSGLSGATGAWYGFWGETRSETKDYEIRIYKSHSDAVSLGKKLAEEVTGDDAIITKEATWKEGIKDRRQVGGGRTKGTLELQATGIFPKYGNYVIYGNIILLCEGQEEIALESCWKLINTLNGSK